MNFQPSSASLSSVRKLLKVAGHFGYEIEPDQRFSRKVEEISSALCLDANMCRKTDSASCTISIAMRSTQIVPCLHAPPFLNVAMK